MYGRKVKLRFFFVLLILITLILSIFFVLRFLEENVVYYQSPSEIKVLSEIEEKKIRIGGMVKNNSILIQHVRLDGRELGKAFVLPSVKNQCS